MSEFRPGDTSKKLDEETCRGKRNCGRVFKFDESSGFESETEECIILGVLVKPEREVKSFTVVLLSIPTMIPSGINNKEESL